MAATKARCLVNIIFWIIINLRILSAPDPTVDVALNKPVTANVTCGISGPERFFSQRFAGIQTQANLETCHNVSIYRAEFIVDGNDQTWWQSTSRISFIRSGYGGVSGRPEAEIAVDLQQTFTVESIVLKFGESQRPGRMVFYRTTDTSPQLLPWFYVVTSALDCAGKYSTQISLLPTTVDSRPCIPYSGPAVLNEEVTLDFSKTPGVIKAWNSIRSLRVEFYDIDLTLGASAGSNEFQHYTLKTLHVYAKCQCNGQLTDCLVNNVTQKYACVCGGNTMGDSCEMCLPLFNNKAYAYAQPCQVCNCNNHASSCHYDANFNNGSGVCDQCQNFTAGANCEKCQPNYYRPANILATDPNPCIPCNCSGIYVDYGCAPIADSSTGMAPGDCFCKPNVGGAKCDRCKEGFYGLSISGCTDCGCQRNGTLGASIACNETGVCNCKRYVSGPRCISCMDGYYNLDSGNPDGCSPCACDVGGAVNLNCDKISGQCYCRQGVKGRACTEIMDGYYFPFFHFLYAEMENLQSPWDKTIPGYSGFGYVTSLPGVPLSATISFAAMNSRGSDMFRIVARYFSATDVSGTMTGAQNGIIISTNSFTLSACVGGSWCFSPTGDVRLPQSPPSSVISFTIPTDSKVLFDRVAAVPLEFFDITNLLGASQNDNYQKVCNVRTNNSNQNSPLGSDCAKYAFTVSVAYLNGALPCYCNSLGGNDTNSCLPYGGQCFCKTGTMGRQCDQCLMQFYSLGPFGCLPCGCNQTTYNMCDSVTGACLCPPGTGGASCNICNLNYYNYDQVRGCQPCNCNGLGSISLSCDVTTGACICKPGVTGLKCDQCMDGYKGMSVIGCSPCNCNPVGSANPVCDKVTGNCVCKTNVMGTLCSSCKLNSFSMNPTFIDGCLACTCMGVSATCSPSNWLPSLFNFRPSPSTLIILDANGNAPPSSVASSNLTNSGFTLASINVPPNSDLYWSDPQLKGNLLSFYGASINFQVLWTAADTSVPPAILQSSLIVISKNGQKINFLLTNYTIPPANTLTAVRTTLLVESTQTPGLKRDQILTALTDVKAVLFPAVFKPAIHQSSIGDVSYIQQPAYVEQCYCPDGHDGKSCETCSVGYMRYNITGQGYLGNCKPCDCNGKSSSCDPLTGYCFSCQQFTTGAFCESCLSGYYRDPAQGSSGPCLKCPCEGPRVGSNDCEFRNSSLVCSNCSSGYVGDQCKQCASNYYGDLGSDFMGVCRLCECNGFSTTCNLQGQCQNCSNFTIGDNCESCIPGKYHVPETSPCIDCNCNITGSMNTVCNVDTGDCTCKYGVNGSKCDRCQDNFYAFSDAGCSPCNCNEFGSSSLQCDGNGACPCKNSTKSLKCDTCEIGYFGIKNGKPCEYCNCEPLGVNNSNPGLAQCNNETGQCTCKLYVTGRRCNQCESMYVNVTQMLDCTACGTCESSLGNDVIVMENTTITSYLSKTTELSALHDLDSELILVQGSVDELCNMLESCTANNLLTRFKSLLQLLREQAASNETKATNLRNRATLANTSVVQISNNSTIQMSKLRDIKTDSEKIESIYGQQLSVLQNYIVTLSSFNETAFKIWLGAPYNGSSTSGITWNYGNLFNNEVSALDALYNRTLSDINRASQLLVNLNSSFGDATQMQASLLTSQVVFDGTTNRIRVYNSSISDYNTQLASLLSTINFTITARYQFEAAYKAVASSVQSTNVLLSNTASMLARCQQNLPDVVNLIYGNYTIRPQVSVDTNFAGWTDAYKKVNDLLQFLSSALNGSLPRIPDAEKKASDLSLQAKNISSAFETVRPKGQQAVDIINKFQSVITTLTSALDRARNYSATLQAVVNYLNSASVADLSARTNQISDMGNQTKQSLNDLMASSTSAGLSSGLDAANSSFQSSVLMWADTDQKYSKFDNDSTQFFISVTSTKESINTNYILGMSLSESLKATTASARQQNLLLQAGLNSTAMSISNANNITTNSLQMQDQLFSNLTAFKAQMDQATQTSLTGMNASQIRISLSRQDLESRFSRVNDLLTQIQTKLTSLEQPVFFPANTYEQVSNPDLNVNELYNSIGLDFSHARQPRGVLFFVENTLTREKLLVQLINNTVCFESSNVDVSTLVCNYAQILLGNWYRVYVTRYELDIKLTVIQLSTGGGITVQGTATSTNNLQISLNSPIYVGGLPLNAANIRKVYDTGIGFNGCIYRVLYNGATLPVWQSILRANSSATCCKKPTVPSSETSVPNCITVLAFGYVVYSPRDSFSLTGQAQVSLQFRTFAPQGVVLLSSSLSTSDYYGVFVQNGKVLFSIFSLGNLVSVATEKAYNTGDWFKFTASHTQSGMTLLVESVATPTQSESKSTTGPINLASLAGLGFSVGGQNPTFERGPVSYGFAGSLKEFFHTTTFSSTMLPDSLTTGINSSSNVDLTKCLDKAQSGLGFVNISSYAKITPMITPIQTLDFTFITKSFSGLLFYTLLEKTNTDGNTFLYIALYNGDIFIIFNQGQGVQPAFRTRNLYFSDGLEHTVSLHFGFTNSPRMKVDNLETHVGAMTMDPFMKLLENYIYVGGVPSSVGLTPANVLPVKLSFVGGIKSISINGILVQFFNPSVLSGQSSKGIYLSGIQTPVPPAPPPCNPCPTTTPTPTCIIPSTAASFLGDNYFNFGDETESYLRYNIAGDESSFLSQFVVYLSFRSMQPDGMLLYLTNSAVLTTPDYFTVYLFKGNVYVMLMSGNYMKSVISKQTYYDGLWHKLTVIRVQNSLSLLIEETQDFNNNNNVNLTSIPNSNLVISSPLYIGGVPFSLASFPNTILSGKVSFKGCITGLQVQTVNFKTILFPSSKIIGRTGVSSCPAGSYLGMSLTSTSSGYIRLSDSYNTNPLYSLTSGFSIFLSFKTLSNSGTLMVAWDNPSKFVAVSLVKGEIQVILSSAQQPFTFTSSAFSSAFQVCNNDFHSVTVNIDARSVSLNIDNTFIQSKDFGLFQYAAPLNVPIYLGGLKDSLWTIPGLFSGIGFTGCIHMCNVNGNVIYITQSSDIRGAFSGCN